ncbi:DEAD/DEAH box helicase [Limnoglobus roseus]|uniref:ATP-dependent helicase n=1 Tax=Limnoglobus roseus TaxID=2598579 RepID=A0A5C1AKK4_9BACT|nr:DEAD/DEAH box helicase [Limnoglobus roseus]QEL19909.1 ATP-dependent helicase [Limnoglobus roseus]
MTPVFRKERPYQREAIDAIKATLAAKDSCVAVIPTGGGKTVVIGKTIREWEFGNCLVLAHTTEIVNQTAEKVGDEIGVPPHVEMGVRGADLGGLWQGDMTVVASVQSMVSNRRLEKYRNYPFGLIVVDECHHATSPSYRKVIDYFRGRNPHLKVLGVTATPNRTDSTALGLVFEDVAYSRDIAFMTSEGWLVPFEQLTVTVDSLDLDTIKVKKARGHEADFTREELEQRLVEERVLHEMATPILQETGGRPTIVFTAGVEHAHALARILNARRPGCAAAVDGKTDPAERTQIVRQFSAGNLQYVCNFGVFTEGFDAPATACVVMARPTKSVSLYTQCVGRGLRPLPGTVDGYATAFDRQAAIATSAKHNCLVLDFVGASRNGVVDCYDVLGGNYDVEVRALAGEAARQGDRCKVTVEDLELAKAVLALRRKRQQESQLLVDSTYRVDRVEDGDGAGSGLSTPVRRGGASDAQVSLLVKLGVRREVAIGYTPAQAGAVIDSVGQSRCTSGQRAILVRHGVDPTGVGVARAGRIIDRIAANNWRVPSGGINLE